MTLSLPVIARDAEGIAPPRRDPAANAGRLIDSHGRTVRDLRLSITDRCNFRCVYCMDPDVRFMDRATLLSVDELVRVARVCVSLGVEKIRLTGGEPSLHPDLDAVIERIAALPVKDVAMTTNGSLLDERRARRWKRLGLSRVTLSLDSLRDDRFAKLTRSNTPPRRVIEAARAASIAGLGPVRINAVIVRGFNDDEVEDLAGIARTLGVDVRLIEFMPLDSAHAWDRSRVVSADEIIERVGRRYPLRSAGRDGPGGTSLNFAFADGAPGRLGIIASVTRPFCGACNRLRVTADGQIRPCLFSTVEYDLRAALRRGDDDEAIARFLLDSTWVKPAGHAIDSTGFEQPARPMSAIGG
ncbi:MAG: GTP 3',8-cyclase MoaA [Phycisphaeraceae bacterium]|nr:GTP 3',8-cyclase MoaA [Phycisphaeraceae bacterium]